jgi:hypothetical protein
MSKAWIKNAEEKTKGNASNNGGSKLVSLLHALHLPPCISDRFTRKAYSFTMKNKPAAFTERLVPAYQTHSAALSDRRQ